MVGKGHEFGGFVLHCAAMEKDGERIFVRLQSVTFQSIEDLKGRGIVASIHSVVHNHVVEQEIHLDAKLDKRRHYPWCLVVVLGFAHAATKDSRTSPLKGIRAFKLFRSHLENLQSIAIFTDLAESRGVMQCSAFGKVYMRLT